jgi:hypothetical protein
MARCNSDDEFGALFRTEGRCFIATRLRIPIGIQLISPQPPSGGALQLSPSNLSPGLRARKARKTPPRRRGRRRRPGRAKDANPRSTLGF